MESYDILLILLLLLLIYKNNIYSYMYGNIIEDTNSNQQNNKFKSALSMEDGIEYEMIENMKNDEEENVLDNTIKTISNKMEESKVLREKEISDNSYNNLMGKLMLQEQCAKNNEKNLQLIEEIKSFKEGINKQQKKYNKLLKEQQEINNQMKLNMKDDLSDIHLLNSYNNGDLGLSGDELLLNKMIDVSLKNKMAINNRVKWSTQSAIPFIEPELQMHEKSIWWDDETLEL